MPGLRAKVPTDKKLGGTKPEERAAQLLQKLKEQRGNAPRNKR